MIDTHCHLTHARLRGDEQAVVARAREAGLAACVSIGTGIEDAQRVVALTERHAGYVFGTAGLDPFSAHEAGDGFDDDLDRLLELLRRGSFVALGEVGLDYHYDLDPRPLQAERLARQLAAAARLELPVVIHVREAHADLAAILAEHPDVRGVIHSFTAGPAVAECYLELGWHLAFNGVATFPTADEVREAARICPAERLLIETDAPYLAPVPLRGKRCEPAHVIHVLARLAELRGVRPETLGPRVAANARRLFGLPAVRPGSA
jgi:TatD DNase family protein